MGSKGDLIHLGERQKAFASTFEALTCGYISLFFLFCVRLEEGLTNSKKQSSPWSFPLILSFQCPFSSYLNQPRLGVHVCDITAFSYMFHKEIIFEDHVFIFIYSFTTGTRDGKHEESSLLSVSR